MKKHDIKYAKKVANNFINQLKLKNINLKKVDGNYKGELNSAIISGSIRRNETYVGDIDIMVIVSPSKKQQVIDRIKNISSFIISSGQDEIKVMSNGIEVDIWFCTNLDYFGAMLLHTTGPAEYNMWLRKLAKDNGYLLNQYGLFKNSKRIAGRTENSIYKKLISKTNPEGKVWKEPELRGK